MKLISSPAEVLNQGYALVDLGYGLPPARLELEQQPEPRKND